MEKEKNPMCKLYCLLNVISDNNKDEQEAIGGYYDLLATIHAVRRDLSEKYDEEKEKFVPCEIPVEIKKILDFCESKTKKIIADEKEHSLDLNQMQLMIDGIAPSTGI